MKRRLVLVTCLLAVAGGGIGSAVAANASSTTRQELCLVLAQDPQGNTTKDFCINWGAPAQR